MSAALKMQITRETQIADILETEVCGRCGGTGHYSFNQIDGTRCYGCGGTGIRYTKRGKAALDYWVALFTTEATLVRPGDRILVSMGQKWETVNEVEDDDTHIRFRTNWGGTGVFRDSQIRLSTKDFPKVPVLKAVADYQANLTKAGQPRKRRAS